ncbi:MAG TPA: RGCVC family protein [Pseudonocardiaceae bacterium]|nr:RGCVC family protein [Pseudonocardiaceae bacterium]
MIAESQVDISQPAAVDPEPTCVVCSHPMKVHDRIGLRFCAATAAGTLDRGCVCVGVADDASHD